MAKDSKSGTVVRRMKANGAGSDSAETGVVTNEVKQSSQIRAGKTPKAQKVKKVRDPNKKPFILFRPIFAIGRYFRDSWHELRQVQWTNRRATWALTLAVILFSAFFAIFVLLADWGFQWLIKGVIL